MLDLLGRHFGSVCIYDHLNFSCSLEFRIVICLLLQCVAAHSLYLRLDGFIHQRLWSSGGQVMFALPVFVCHASSAVMVQAAVQLLQLIDLQAIIEVPV